MSYIKLYITGGSGAGASSIGKLVSEKLNIAYFDTDVFFHKSTDPPYQEQYSRKERNKLLFRELKKQKSWVLSGSIATWEVEDVSFTHGVVLNPGTNVRISRLKLREQNKFGDRIKEGGDMYQMHVEFLDWAKGYEKSSNKAGRSLAKEVLFIKKNAEKIIEIADEGPIVEITEEILAFSK